MKKREFLAKLEKMTDELVAAYYEELISDRIEAGEKESDIISSFDLKKIARESSYKEIERLSRENRKWKTWVVILALFSTPITIPLGFAFVVTLLALMVSALAIIFSGIVAPIGTTISGIQLIVAGYAWLGVMYICVGLLVLGALGLFGIYAFTWLRALLRWLLVKFFSFKKNREVTA